MTDQQQRFVNEIRLSDPQYDKENLKSVKGGLLVDSFQWIIHHSDFQRWRNDDCTFLWISGNPGKGKTMLLIGIIDELAAHQESEIAADVGFLSFFFCQANDSRYNNPAAVLRGLIYLLVNQEPALISNLPKKYDNEMRGSLDDGNAFFVLCEIFEYMICDPILTKACLVIDALDECPVRQKQFLDVIVRCASRAKHVKWLVSSRNERTVEDSLSRIEGHKRLRLESNVESVSDAVNTYIDHKVSVLAKNKRYESDLENTVRGYLRSNAEDTFLWVALVCQNLEGTSIWNTPRSLQDFPPGLPSLYKRVVQQICDFEDKRDSELCKKILAVATITNRHLVLAELATLVDVLSDISAHSDWLVQIIGLCGSFLTIRRGTIYFVHQSAKEYLSKDENVIIFPSGTEEVHKTVFSQSLKAMSHTLCRDIYGLRNPGSSTFDLAARERDPLEPLRYSCVHWVHHLGRSQSIHSPINPTVVSDVESFLRNKLLPWLEALVLLGSNSDGGLSVAVRSMGSLEKILDVSSMVRIICPYSRIKHVAYMYSRGIRTTRQFLVSFETRGVLSSTIGQPLRKPPFSYIVRLLYFHQKTAWYVSNSVDRPPNGYESSSMFKRTGHLYCKHSMPLLDGTSSPTGWTSRQTADSSLPHQAITWSGYGIRILESCCRHLKVTPNSWNFLRIASFLHQDQHSGI
jgi:hypothetical protein